ncbi:chitinase 1 precursor [Ophiostoma piceae UAMH 11346]|uniref:chitinase n=1 Tax=Ophiostoma piceae (strain UAMH 11346) TaxID=1262450 RepID=S3BZT7_OPHP1|nr:chitinase 1 precursor [Ophiostoma piceae UAMH 11346]
MKCLSITAVACLLASQAAALPPSYRRSALDTTPSNCSSASATGGFGTSTATGSASKYTSYRSPSAPGKYHALVNGTTNSTGPNGYSSSLYFTNWGIYGANFQPQNIPVDKVTRVLYSFADISSDGTVKSSDTYADVEKRYPTDSWSDPGTNAYGCVKQLYLLKKANRHLKVLLSIGGWTYSPKFAPMAATSASRSTFAATAVKLATDWGFDGIDIDWEYPTDDTEARNFVLLLRAVRAELDAYARKNAPGYHFLITIASPAGPKHYNAMDMAGMDPYVDAWNLMAYDYAGSWDTSSGHQANIYVDPKNTAATKYSTERAVTDYMAQGIKPGKVMLGLPLYGRSFEATKGLGQNYSGVGDGTSQPGIWLYKDLPRSGATEIYDNVAKASYSYDNATRELISYDNAASAAEKSAYLARKGLGGAVFWEASGDRNDSKSLIGTVSQKMGNLDTTMNLLKYPTSQYDNIRTGMSD